MTAGAPKPVGFVEPPRSAVSEAVARALAEDLLPLGDLTAAGQLLNNLQQLASQIEAKAASAGAKPGAPAAAAAAAKPPGKSN